MYISTYVHDIINRDSLIRKIILHHWKYCCCCQSGCLNTGHLLGKLAQYCCWSIAPGWEVRQKCFFDDTSSRLGVRYIIIRKRKTNASERSKNYRNCKADTECKIDINNVDICKNKAMHLQINYILRMA